MSRHAAFPYQRHDADAVASAGERLTVRVVLHIGSTKTGSSALQAALHERRADLASIGAHYSASGVAAGAHHVLAASIHPGAWRMHADALPEDRDAYFASTVATIKEEAAALGAHSILLSSEYFWGSFPAQLYKRFAEAFRPATFEVVAFVRRPDEWVASSYLQAVKSGEHRPFNEWFEHVMGRWTSGLQYFRVINRWNYFLGAEKVHVLRYADTKANVYKAFCDALELQPDTTAPIRSVNPSPSAESVGLLLAINRSEMDDAEKAAQRRRIMLSQGAGAPADTVMSEAERAAVFRLTRQSDQLLGRVFLHDGRPPFPPAAPDLPVALPPSENTH